MNTEYVKCASKEGGYSVTRCEALNSVIEFYPRSTSKGVFGKSIVNIESNEPLGTMIIAKSGKHKSRGMVMNVCPFCGGSLMYQDNKE